MHGFCNLKKFFAEKAIAVLFLGLTFSWALPLPAYAARNPLAPLTLSLLTNEERSLKDLGPLSVNELLNKAAQMKAENMARLGYFAHTSPKGVTPWYWIKQAGYKYEYAGENLAVDFRKPEEITRAWMQSPSHRANIVDKHYTEIGTGVATGYYRGKKVTFVAQVYANPAFSPKKKS